MVALRMMGRVMGRLLFGLTLVMGMALGLAWAWDHSDAAAPVAAAAPGDLPAAAR